MHPFRASGLPSETTRRFHSYSDLCSFFSNPHSSLLSSGHFSHSLLKTMDTSVSVAKPLHISYIKCDCHMSALVEHAFFFLADCKLSLSLQQLIIMLIYLLCSLRRSSEHRSEPAEGMGRSRQITFLQQGKKRTPNSQLVQYNLPWLPQSVTLSFQCI